MWTSLDILGFVLAAGLLRWIAYLIRIRREQDEHYGQWRRHVD